MPGRTEKVTKGGKITAGNPTGRAPGTYTHGGFRDHGIGMAPLKHFRQGIEGGCRGTTQARDHRTVERDHSAVFV